MNYAIAVVIVVIVAALTYYLAGGSPVDNSPEALKSAFRSKDWNTVIKLGSKNVLLDKLDPEPLYYLAIAYQKKGIIDKALGYVKMIIDDSLANQIITESQVYKIAAELYQDKEEYDEALKYLFMIKEIDTQDSDSLFSLGKLYYKKKDYNKAIENLQQALSIKNSYVEAYSLIGYAKFELLIFDEALKYIKAAEKLGLNNGKLNFTLAVINEKKGLLDEASSYYQKALDGGYEKFKCLVKLAENALQRGSLETAKKQYEMALKEAVPTKEGLPLINETRYRLANVCRQLGDTDGAFTNWSNIAKVDPGFRDVAEKIQTFSGIKKSNELVNLYSLSYFEFENICKKILVKMGHVIKEVRKEEAENITFKTTYFDKNADVDCLSKFNRSIVTIGDLEIKSLAEAVRAERIYKGVYFCTTSFSAGALEASNISPIDLVDGKKLAAYIKKIS